MIPYGSKKTFLPYSGRAQRVSLIFLKIMITMIMKMIIKLWTRSKWDKKRSTWSGVDSQSEETDKIWENPDKTTYPKISISYMYKYDTKTDLEMIMWKGSPKSTKFLEKAASKCANEQLKRRLRNKEQMGRAIFKRIFITIKTVWKSRKQMSHKR